jgi:hypothetical protein
MEKPEITSNLGQNMKNGWKKRMYEFTSVFEWKSGCCFHKTLNSWVVIVIILKIPLQTLLKTKLHNNDWRLISRNETEKHKNWIYKQNSDKQ